jgi:hypothetical protein
MPLHACHNHQWPVQVKKQPLFGPAASARKTPIHNHPEGVGYAGADSRSGSCMRQPSACWLLCGGWL